ncbi:MAG TPA: TIGR03016 family PEP-CTERM system-associated outer membrane protein [Burkholderiales bacterium]|nr:TIGR03016 family PEP-CTERM system-associated outer membrane protein [Burkholderiales bacterium]
MPGANAGGLAPWTVNTDITVRETYNDNPGLAPAGREEHDFITEITPGLRMSGSGPRLRGYFDYRPSLIYYAHGTSEDRFLNRLTGFGTLEAVDNFFYIDANASITQDYLSPFGARPADVTISTPNQLETRTVGLSPYVRGALLRDYSYELRYRKLWTTTDRSELGNLDSDYWTGRLASQIRLFGWALEYEASKIHYEQFTAQPDRETRLARARLYFQPDYAWRFTASAGREENNYRSLGSMEASDMYGAGVTWAPSNRTLADVQYEERFFGPYRLARFNHRTRLTAWNVTYLRDISDFQQEALRLPPGFTLPLVDAIFRARIPDPIERQEAIEQFYRNSATPLFLSSSLAFYTQQIVLQERLEGSVRIIGVRNSIGFSAFARKSNRFSEGLTGILPDAFLQRDELKEKGFGAYADHKLTPFTTISLTGRRTFATRDEPSRLESRNDFVALTLNHSLSPNTNAFAGVSYTGVRDELPTVVNREANSVYVGLTHRF